MAKRKHHHVVTLVFWPFSRTNHISQYQNVCILDFIRAKDDGGIGENWSYNICTAPVKSSPPTNQHSVHQTIYHSQLVCCCLLRRDTTNFLRITLTDMISQLSATQMTKHDRRLYINSTRCLSYNCLHN